MGRLLGYHVLRGAILAGLFWINNIHGQTYELARSITPGSPALYVPKTGLHPQEVGVVVHTNDPHSLQAAQYYVQRRQIPPENVFYLSLPLADAISQTDALFFHQQLLQQIVQREVQTGIRIQALALMWKRPFQVGFYRPETVSTGFIFGPVTSMTSALANGSVIDPPGSSHFNAPTPHYYFDTNSIRPVQDHGLRLAMMIGGDDFDERQVLIDRGVQSDFSFPQGSAYYVTTDEFFARCFRDAWNLNSKRYWNRSDGILSLFNSTCEVANSHPTDFDAPSPVTGMSSLLFHFMGDDYVPQWWSNQYLPGALGDNVTSYGGWPDAPILHTNCFLLTEMSNGLTGCYGQVIEGGAIPQKYSQPGVVIRRYFEGATAVEAYWKSVQSPQEGVFVGDPLARPFGTKTQMQNGNLQITTTVAEPNYEYTLEGAWRVEGPWNPIWQTFVPHQHQIHRWTIANPQFPIYRLRKGTFFAPFALDQRPPSIDILNFNEYTNFEVRGSRTMEVFVTDDNAVERVEFLNSQSSHGIAAVDRAPPFTHTIYASGRPQGFGSFWIRAYDYNGNYSELALNLYIHESTSCLADFAGGGTADLNDLFEYLDAFFAQDPRANLDGGALDLQDLFSFLEAWFRGCP